MKVARYIAMAYKAHDKPAEWRRGIQKQDVVRDCWGLPPSLAAVLPWNVPLPPVLPSRVAGGASRAPTVARRPSLRRHSVNSILGPIVQQIHPLSQVSSLDRQGRTFDRLERTFRSSLIFYCSLLSVSKSNRFGKCVDQNLFSVAHNILNRTNYCIRIT